MKRVGSLLLVLTCVVVIGLPVFAQQNSSPTNNPLINLLQSKGILSSEEAATVMQASTPDEANRRLAQLLVVKGLISEQEYQTTVDTSATATPQSSPSAFGQFVRAVYHPSLPPNPVVAEQTTAAPKPPEPSVIPAVAPLRAHPMANLRREVLPG